MYFQNKAKHMVSSEFGILRGLSKLTIQSGDPNLIAYGVLPSNTVPLGAAEFQGRSSGCSTDQVEAFMTTIGEVAERYAPAFYDTDQMMLSSYNDLPAELKSSPEPEDYALYHPRQYELYKANNVNVLPFDKNRKLHWTDCIDLTNGNKCAMPSALIYMPFLKDKENITFTTSTGLSAHTSIARAILTSLYECIERDAFTIAWSHLLDVPKIKITSEIKDYVDSIFNTEAELHLVDITLDLELPTVFGFAISKTEFGSIITVGSSTRPTYGEAIKKVVKECAQAVSYMRYTLGANPNWSKKKMELLDFEDHSVYYNIYRDERKVFDHWKNLEKERIVKLNEKSSLLPTDQVRRILKIFKKKGYSVLFKDTTTVDINQCGFYSVKIFVPQLIQMSGAFPFYFWGGKRMYEVPPALGHPAKGFQHLNRYPHPFP